MLCQDMVSAVSVDGDKRTDQTGPVGQKNRGGSVAVDGTTTVFEPVLFLLSYRHQRMLGRFQPWEQGVLGSLALRCSSTSSTTIPCCALSQTQHCLGLGLKIFAPLVSRTKCAWPATETYTDRGNEARVCLCPCHDTKGFMASGKTGSITIFGPSFSDTRS